MKKAKKDGFDYQIALAGLESGAIKISPKEPFLNTFGRFNPINIDCNTFLLSQRHREIVLGGLIEITRNSVNLHHRSLAIAGARTGIPWASFLVEMFKNPLLYIQNNHQSSNSKNREECGNRIDLSNYRAILIDDVISTGRRNASAVASIREMNGICDLCVSIIDYGFPEAEKVFIGELPFERNGFDVPIESLKSPCEKKSLLNLLQLIPIAWDKGFIEKEEEETLLKWMEDPEYWGDKHGFPSLRRK